MRISPRVLYTGGTIHNLYDDALLLAYIYSPCRVFRIFLRFLTNQSIVDDIFVSVDWRLRYFILHLQFASLAYVLHLYETNC